MTISRETFKSRTAYVLRSDDVATNMQGLMDEQIEVILNHRATEGRVAGRTGHRGRRGGPGHPIISEG